MGKFTTELLVDGVTVTAHPEVPDLFVLTYDTEQILISKREINRLHGIAFPEKRRTGECDITKPLNEQQDGTD